jgi:hypothetical protein
VWSSKNVNARKGNRLPHEAGLRLLKQPRAPKELPVTALLRNAHGVAEWKLFLNDKAQPLTQWESGRQSSLSLQ